MRFLTVQSSGRCCHESVMKLARLGQSLVVHRAGIEPAESGKPGAHARPGESAEGQRGGRLRPSGSLEFQWGRVSLYVSLARPPLVVCAGCPLSLGWAKKSQQSRMELRLGLSRGSRRANDLDCGRAS